VVNWTESRFHYDKEWALRDQGYRDGLSQGKAEGFSQGKAEGREEGKAEGISEGISEGKIENKKEIAKNMLSKAMEVELISEITGLSIEEIKNLK